MKTYHKDYDIVDGKLTKPFSKDKGRSRTDVIVSFFLSYYDDGSKYTNSSPYNLDVQFVFFAKSGPHHERFVIRSWGKTRKECFNKLRDELRKLRFVASTNL